MPDPEIRAIPDDINATPGPPAHELPVATVGMAVRRAVLSGAPSL